MSSALGINVLQNLKLTIDKGIEIIQKKGYVICENVKFEEIKAAGLKISEISWEAFLQLCERIYVNLGKLKVYLDFEARVMFVYSDSTETPEVYYVQFA
jgi:hypothetical protein